MKLKFFSAYHLDFCSQVVSLPAIPRSLLLSCPTAPKTSEWRGWSLIGRQCALRFLESGSPSRCRRQSVGTILHSTFRENLLPGFNIPDLWHTDTAFAVFLQDLYKDIDLGVAYNSNFVNMGINSLYDSRGDSISSARSYEWVHSVSLGVRYAKIISVGASIKRFESALAPGVAPGSENNGIAEGTVFDLGLRLEKKFTVARVLDITPALGLSIANCPRDSVFYVDPNYKDPLPLERWAGGSVKLNLLNFLGFTGAVERNIRLSTSTLCITTALNSKFRRSTQFSAAACRISMVKGMSTTTDINGRSITSR